MRDVYVIGTSCTPFGKHAEQSFHDLSRQAYLELLADAGLGTGDVALNEQAWFGNCGMGQWGQGGIRGQVAFPAVLQRYAQIEPATETQQWLKSLVFGGMTALPVRVRPV